MTDPGEYRRAYEGIRHILWKEWDPIGVNRNSKETHLVLSLASCV